jgi:hypothetical protein
MTIKLPQPRRSVVYMLSGLIGHGVWSEVCENVRPRRSRTSKCPTSSVKTEHLRHRQSWSETVTLASSAQKWDHDFTTNTLTHLWLVQKHPLVYRTKTNRLNWLLSEHTKFFPWTMLCIDTYICTSIALSTHSAYMNFILLQCYSDNGTHLQNWTAQSCNVLLISCHFSRTLNILKIHNTCSRILFGLPTGLHPKHILISTNFLSWPWLLALHSWTTL